jgi:hypothetical protein
VLVLLERAVLDNIAAATLGRIGGGQGLRVWPFLCSILA